MGANKLFVVLVVILMVHLNMAEPKSYSKPSSLVQNITDDQVPVGRSLHYKTILNVAPFPYLPDLDGDNNRNLLRYIQEEFYKLYPDVLLALRPMNTSDPFYDVRNVSLWLDMSGKEYDIVEIDTVILGDLVEAGVVAPQYLMSKYLPNDWHSAAASAIQINGEVYAYPHLICAFLLFTRDNSIASAVTIDELFLAVQNLNWYFPYGLVGNLNSSWDNTALYLDSYRESAYPHDETYGLQGIWSVRALDALRKLAELCSTYLDKNECVDGRFRNDYDLPAKIFGINQAKALYGYPERLHHILKHAQSIGPINHYQFKIKPLPLGDFTNQPLFFTDAYVFRRNMSEDKLTAARKFVEFMATPRMQAAVAGIEDTARVRYPIRYLLPMSSKAYDVPPLNSDYFYQSYFRNLTGRSFPNQGMNKLRSVAREIIYLYISRKY